MPVTNIRTCATCGDEFDATDFWNHFTICDAPGCGEHYCPSYSECIYCEGNGYQEDEDDYEYDSGSGIYSYDYKPEPMWLGGEDQPYYLGFELEITADRMNTAPLYKWCEDNATPGMLYCKEDGSVNGFEIVSHPMTPAYFDSVDWDSFFNMLEEHWPMNGCDEAHGHGLHVHVSRTAFNGRNSTLARWNLLLNKNREHVNRVARRENSRWAEFTDYPVSVLLPYDHDNARSRWITDYDRPLACGCCYERVLTPPDLSARIRRQFQSRVMPQRYQAVNLTNRDTVEVRVFRSTRKPAEFIASLHFVAATVEFVRTMQPWHATRVATQWDTFAEYVAAHPIFSKQATVIAGVCEAVPPPVPSHTHTMREVREWARNQGYPVGTRGRIPRHVLIAHSILADMATPQTV